jgi:hypothetical protein
MKIKEMINQSYESIIHGSSNSANLPMEAAFRDEAKLSEGPRRRMQWWVTPVVT